MEIAALVVGITAGLFVILFGSRGLMDLGRDMAGRRRARKQAEADPSPDSGAPTTPTATAVVEAAHDQPRLPLAPPALYRTVFVGRQAELTTLQAAFDKAGEGQGSVVLLTGDAGMGKTAICLQLGEYAERHRGAVVHTTEVGLLLRGPAQQALSRDLSRGLEPFTEALSELATTCPLLLCIEDLQDAGETDLNTFSVLAERAPTARIMVVGTARSVETLDTVQLSGGLEQVRRGSRSQRVGLRPLSVDEIDRMVQELTRQQMGRELAEAIHGESQGNPLFAQELVRYLGETGHLSLAGDRWSWDGGLPSEVVASKDPRAIIGQRLGGLSERARTLLADAANDAFRFEVPGDAAAVEASLADAVERRLIEPEGDEYAFTHRLVRDGFRGAR